jgi:glutamate racemase
LVALWKLSEKTPMVSRNIFLTLPLFIVIAASCSNAKNGADSLKSVLNKDSITILITDSGLGGLSVCGELEVKAAQSRSFKEVTLIFCNALPETNFGYNNIDNDEKKARVFSDVLRGMVKWYNPDVILIACNTLSVVYPSTQFSKEAHVPVVGIVDLGVDMIHEKMAADLTSETLIFGTETTIFANTHKSMLLSAGIAPNRIITQPCSDLAGEIQSDAKSDMVKNLIEMYVSEAVEQLPKNDSGRIYASLCCTHYGYCADMFADALKANGKTNVEIINPNDKMADVIITPDNRDRFSGTSVTAKVVSRAFISPEEIQSLNGFLESKYPLTAAALKRYEQKRDLFLYERE